MTSEGEDAKDKSQAFLQEFDIGWPNGYGAQAAIEALGVRGIPTVFVIGADGRVAWHDELGGELGDAIAAALAQAAAGP